jgi:hypothetical protein
VSANDFAKLDAWIAKLKRAPGELKAISPEAAKEVQAALAGNLSAGKAPDGSAWAERKEGGRAYAGAAGSLDTQAVNSTIVATITGPEVYGHRGVRGAKPREMLPTTMVPIVAIAIKRAVMRRLKKVFA